MAKTKNLEDYSCVFPDIDYHAAIAPLTVQGVPPAMLTFVRERAGWTLAPAGLTTLGDLETSIAGYTWAYAEGGRRDDGILQEVFHRVQVWGGEHGRYIYVQGPAFDWAEIGPAYRKLVLACLDGDRGVADLARKGKAFNAVMRDQGRRLGLSFITKHMHFWSAVARGGDALPIFDRIMARGLRLRPVWEHLEIYWTGMERKALEEGVSVSALERQLFNLFREGAVMED